MLCGEVRVDVLTTKREENKELLFKQGTRESFRVFNVIYSCF